MKLKENFPKNFFLDIAKDVIKHWILVCGGLAVIIIFLKKIVAFFNINLNLQIGLFVVCLLLAFLIGYEIFKPKTKKGQYKTSFKNYGDFSWLVETYSNGDIIVKKNPHCPKCHTEYQDISVRFGEIILICPKPDCKNFGGTSFHTISMLDTVHGAVQKVVEAEAREYSKK